MKYIEEINHGQIFLYRNQLYVLTSDFQTQNTRTKHMCIQLNNGFAQWLASDTIVDIPPIFYQDGDNILHQIKY